MDKKLRETTLKLGVEIMNSKLHVKRKLGHVNVMLNLCIFLQ